MSFTEEQIKRWCLCPDEPVVIRRACPLHTSLVVEWITFRREVHHRYVPFEAIGLSFSTDDCSSHADALERAEYEQASIKRYDTNNYAEDEMEYELRYRLISPWVPARA